MPVIKRKVYAYLVHAGKLRVFRHRDFPEAGIQVPGGRQRVTEIGSHERVLLANSRKAKAAVGQVAAGAAPPLFISEICIGRRPSTVTVISVS